LTNKNSISGIVTNVDILSTLGAGEKYSVFKKNHRSLKISVDKIMNKNPITIGEDTTLDRVLYVFNKLNRGSFPVVNADNNVTGMIAEWDFVRKVKNKTGIKINEAATSKPIFVDSSFTVFEVSKMMCRGAYKNLPVTEDGILIGLITPLKIMEYVHKESLARSFKNDDTPVKDIMINNPRTAYKNDDISEAVKLMRIDQTPLFITEDRILKGILTKKDILDVLT